MEVFETYEQLLTALLTALLENGDLEGIVNGRHVRYLGHMSIFQVSDDNFDGWGNSVELEFDLASDNGITDLGDWLNGNE